MNRAQLRSFVIFTLVLSASIYSLFNDENPVEELQKYFQNCEYQKAIELADQILQNPHLSHKEKTKVYTIKGVSEFSSNQVLSSRITFAELILYDKNIELDQKEVSPKIISFFNDLKERLIAENI